MGFRGFLTYIRRDVFHHYHYSDDFLEACREVREKIEAGYDPREDPESPYYEGDAEPKYDRVRSNSPHPSKVDYGQTKYKLVEEPRYLKNRYILAEEGYDLLPLDFVIMNLLDGKKLDKKYKPHKLKGTGGISECHIKSSDLGDNWVLLYQHDHKQLVLYAIDAGTHKDCGLECCLHQSD